MAVNGRRKNNTGIGGAAWSEESDFGLLDVLHPRAELDGTV